MLKAAVITPDPRLSERLRDMLSDSPVARLGRTLDKYPSERELEGFLRANCPSIVFLDLVRLDAALAAAKEIEITNPGTQIVAMSSQQDPEVLIGTMRAGIREIVPLPLELQALWDAVERAGEILVRRPLANHTTDRVFYFLPAKPGGGASTIAVNASLALSRLAPQKTLLLDLDLNQGVTSFLLKLMNPHSVRDAMDCAHMLDESLWASLVTACDNLDVLGAGLVRDSGLDGARLADVMEYARRCYGAVCVDLSGNMEDELTNLLRDARQIFLVCTQDIAGLHLARLKAEMLRKTDLCQRACVILNRTERKPTFSIQEVEKMLGMRVRFSFPRDDKRVEDATASGVGVDRNSELGKQFDALAHYMLDTDTSGAGAQSHKFLEYFSITPKSFAFGPRKSN